MRDLIAYLRQHLTVAQTRQVPDNIGELVYVVTLEGRGGRLADFKQLLVNAGYLRDLDSKRLGPLYSYSPFEGFLALERPDLLEVDIYSNEPLALYRTSTNTFRKGVGALLTAMLQTGYIVSSRKIGPPPGISREDFSNLDF